MNIIVLFVLAVIQLSTSVVNCLLTYFCNLDTQKLITNENIITENITTENIKYDNSINQNLNESFNNKNLYLH